MRKISLMAILIAVLMAGFGILSCSWSQTSSTTADDIETMENQAINDEGYGNADAEYYGSKDDQVNDDAANDESSP